MNTDNIHDSNDWTVLFNLLECAGAGAKPPPMVNSDPSDVVSDTGNGYISTCATSTDFFFIDLFCRLLLLMTVLSL